MLKHIINWSLANRAVVIGLCVIGITFGLHTATQLPVEVLPDLTKPTVMVLTEAPRFSPEEVEMRVTQPLESALTGVPGLTRLRSNSEVALSLVYAEFDWGTDIYKARTLVQERLQAARPELPEGTVPFMTPVASLMGEILLVRVRSTIKPGAQNYLSPSDVRSLADWMLKRRLQSIPGIAEVLNMGGGIKQLEILPDPYKMQAHSISTGELEAAVAAASHTSTGGFLTTGATEIIVRNLASTTELTDIARTVIKTINDRAISVGDVAHVAWGTETMRGDATVSKASEKTPTYGVIMSITKSPGYDTRKLTAQINQALRELQSSLPEGVETDILFQQKDFIDHAIGNLTGAIRDGAIMVAAVLFLFLLNFRTTFITLMAIPLSLAITLLVFKAFHVSVNSMMLGGLAVAVGMVVDDAIIDVENVFRRLRENGAKLTPLPRLQVIANASGEVRNSIFYATVLIILTFLPLLGLTGVEGKLFAPIAMATMVSLVASFIVSLTAVPVLCSLLLRPRAGQPQKDSRFVGGLKWLLERTLLRAALSQPVLVLTLAFTLLLAAFSLYPFMEKDFLPKFQEETALVAATSAPGTSLEEMNRISDVLEQQILSVPGVRIVGRRLGRAERGDHVVPVSTAEFDVDFRKAEGSSGKSERSRKLILEDISTKIRAVPGVFAVVGGPLADRIGHMLSGVSAPVAVKIFGPDLQKIRELGQQVQQVAKSIPGLEDAKLDQASTIPQLNIVANRERCLAYGISPGKVTEALSALLAGKEVSLLRDGQKTFKVVTRLPLERRNSVEQIAQLPIEVALGKHVPLSMLADVREAKGPNVILRENNLRRFAIGIKPTVAGVAGLVARLKQKSPPR